MKARFLALVFLTLGLTAPALAQIEQVKIGVNGMT